MPIGLRCFITVHAAIAGVILVPKHQQLVQSGWQHNNHSQYKPKINNKKSINTIRKQRLPRSLVQYTLLIAISSYNIIMYETAIKYKIGSWNSILKTKRKIPRSTK